MTIIKDPEKMSFRSQLGMFIKLIRISYQAAFYNKMKTNTKAYVVFEVLRDGCHVSYQGSASGSVYTLYFLSHLLRDRFLREVRNHEGSEATLENARTIINSQN